MLPCLVDFRSHPRRTSKFRHRDENPVTASPLQLCTFARFLREESALTNCDARNSFKFCFYENCRVVLVFLSKDLGFNLNLVFPSRALGSLFSLFAPRAFYNSFPFRSIHTLSKNSGVAPPSRLHFSGCSPLESPLTYPLSFHALAHSLRQWGTVIAFVFMILHTLSASTGVYPPSLNSSRTKMKPIATNVSLTGVLPRRTFPPLTSHESPVTSTLVAAFPPGCYDLVFHDPC